MESGFGNHTGRRTGGKAGPEVYGRLQEGPTGRGQGTPGWVWGTGWPEVQVAQRRLCVSPGTCIHRTCLESAGVMGHGRDQAGWENRGLPWGVAVGRGIL